MATGISIGSIIYLKNGQADGGYLDTYGWVADTPAFWNVAGTERIFVSTHGAADRGGGTTSWRIVSADGKADGTPLAIGDRVHLLNMYPEAGYLDCCGWVQDLPPFSPYVGKVTSGVFTSGAQNRDNGTGIWIIRSAAQKSHGEPLLEHDAIYLDNGHPHAGFLVAQGKVTEIPAFSSFAGQELLVFTSALADRSAAQGTWQVLLSHLDQRSKPLLFDFFRPELLKGRSHNMEAVRNMTTIVFRDAFLALAGLSIADAEALLEEQRQAHLLRTMVGSPTPGKSQSLSDVIDYDFQLKQLLNLYLLSQTLREFDQTVLYELMSKVLEQHSPKQTLSPLYLVRRCFQAVATDYEIIQRAVVQRRWTYNELDQKYYQSKQAEELLVMDKLAVKALSYVQHLLQDEAEQLAIITYFSDTTHIRHLPYTKQFLLLGVNYDRISPIASIAQPDALHEPYFSAFELMAIPHEIGHYIYQHGKLQDGTTFLELSESFADHIYYHWCEELFADLYGCIVAGPLAVFGMQAFLTSGDAARAWHDDNEHPNPIVRCYILSEMLRVLSAMDTSTAKRYGFDKVIRALDTDWSRVLEGWSYQRLEKGEGRPTRIYMPGDPLYLERILNVERMIDALRPIIETFATALLSALAERPADIPWCSIDDGNAAVYAREMAALTGRETARAQVARADIAAVQLYEATELSQIKAADKRLAWYVGNWGDKGPATIGGHKKG